jgi:DNA-binding XRE family transcriptional regulator
MKRQIHRKQHKDSGLWVATMFRLRKELGMTQAQFATAIGMSKDAVVSWECGRNEMRLISALRISAQLQRNIMSGKAEPITGAELVQSRVLEYERSLRRRLGV